MHQSAAMKWPPIMECLLQRIEHEARMSRSADPPANNPAGVGINGESNIDKACPGADIEPVLGLDPRMKSETQSAFGLGA
jgi:hypothetical protein